MPDIDWPSNVFSVICMFADHGPKQFCHICHSFATVLFSSSFLTHFAELYIQSIYLQSFYICNISKNIFLIVPTSSTLSYSLSFTSSPFLSHYHFLSDSFIVSSFLLLPFPLFSLSSFFSLSHRRRYSSKLES